MEPSKENARRQPGVGDSQNCQVPFCYPPRGTVKGRVLIAFLLGEQLTHLDAWRRFGSSRLAHHVWALREDGWPVKTDEQTVTTSDSGRRAVIAVYTLPEAAIQAAGEAGQQFAKGGCDDA